MTLQAVTGWWRAFRSAGVAVALLGPLVVPTAASAATATAHGRYDKDLGHYDGTVRFTATPGERNRLTASRSGRRIVFSDAANPVRARGDCRRLDDHRASCPGGGSTLVRLRDGDDRARLRIGAPLRRSTSGLWVYGGAGDDVLLGSRISDDLAGGGGDDTLRGGRGSDYLTGGAGNDRLFGGRGYDVLIDGETDANAASDVFDGGLSPHGAGAGEDDTIDYAKRRRALRIDLGRRRSSTEDRIIGIESIIGGHGADRLYGNDDDSQFEGGPGDDDLRGRGGRDVLWGGDGDDHLDGGEGDDIVRGDDGRDHLFGGDGHDLVFGSEYRIGQADNAGADDLDCGGGTDEAAGDGVDTLSRGCEWFVAFFTDLRLSTRPAIDSDSADFIAGCPPGSSRLRGACDVSITLRVADGQPLGETRVTIAPGAERTQVSVPITPDGAAVLRMGTTVEVELVSHTGVDMGSREGYRAFMRAG